MCACVVSVGGRGVGGDGGGGDGGGRGGGGGAKISNLMLCG